MPWGGGERKDLLSKKSFYVSKSYSNIRGFPPFPPHLPSFKKWRQVALGFFHPTKREEEDGEETLPGRPTPSLLAWGSTLNSSTDWTERPWSLLLLIKRCCGANTSNRSRGQLNIMSPRSHLLATNSWKKHFGRTEIPGNTSPPILPGARVTAKQRKQYISFNRV